MCAVCLVALCVFALVGAQRSLPLGAGWTAVGSAVSSGELTAAVPDAVGELWWAATQAWLGAGVAGGGFAAGFSFTIVPGSSPAAADGLCVAWQTKGAAAAANAGSGIGLGGITESFGVCLDTFLLDDMYDDSRANDFMSTNVYLRGDVGQVAVSPNLLSPAATILDGSAWAVSVVYSADAGSLSWSLTGGANASSSGANSSTWQCQG